MRALLLALALTTTAQAQWQILPTPTTADLRGIHAVSPEIAWASGTNGTVLRTTDGGAHWNLCTIPPDAEKLDFRGIQAYDAQIAVVMSSGKGPLSRLYKTTDACKTWRLVFTNPDPEGFWDAIRFLDPNFGVLIGDPVHATTYAVWTNNAGETWHKFQREDALSLDGNATLFAASNSAITLPSIPNTILAIANNGKQSLLLEADFGEVCRSSIGQTAQASSCPKDYTWLPPVTMPVNLASDTSGLFSIATTNSLDEARMVAVGGDYRSPDQQGLAVCSDGIEWHPAQTPPHGYRSAVAYSPNHKTWITVGPNGTDISTDNGRIWRALKPTRDEAPDSDRNWNALSLPYVVGPHGRIGKLRPTALR